MQNSIKGVTPAKAGVQKLLKRLDSRFRGNDNLGLLQLDRGFTLIEIMVALTVMGFAVVSLVQLFSSNLRMIGTSQDYMMALTRAESVMREIVESDKIEEKSWKDTTDQGYHVEVTVSETQKERTDNLPIKLLQIDLVFSWEKALRKKSITLRTLKVVNKVDNRSVAERK